MENPDTPTPQAPLSESHLLEGDEEQQTAKLVDLAKARFRRFLRESMEDVGARQTGTKRRSRRASTAKAIDAFADVAGLTIEEQATMQIACLTQGVVDCATRAAIEAPLDGEDDDRNFRNAVRQPPDARRSNRHAELANARNLAAATGQLVAALSYLKTNGNVRHTFTYEHLERHVAAAAAASKSEEPETEAEPVDERAAALTDVVFQGLVVTPATGNDDTPSPHDAA